MRSSGAGVRYMICSPKSPRNVRLGASYEIVASGRFFGIEDLTLLGFPSMWITKRYAVCAVATEQCQNLGQTTGDFAIMSLHWTPAGGRVGTEGFCQYAQRA
jgi:hypothetical protein